MSWSVTWVASTPLTSPSSSWRGTRNWSIPTRQTWLSNRTGTFIWPRVCPFHPCVENSTSARSLMETQSINIPGVSYNGNMLTLFWILLHVCRELNIVDSTILLLSYRAKHVKHVFVSTITGKTHLLRSKFGFQLRWLHWRVAFPMNHYIFFFLTLSVTITIT